MRGIIVAANDAIEWQMAWWYPHLREMNQDPIVIFDLGLSKAGLARAKSIGTVIQPELPTLAMDYPLKEEWLFSYHGDLDAVRRTWFLKPFVFAQTPFEETLWLDLDCKVQGSLEPIYEYSNQPSGLSLAHDSDESHKKRLEFGMRYPDEVIYNSGVVSYRKDSILLKSWIEEVKERHDQYFSDQEALSRVIYRSDLEFEPLPKIYNGRLWHKPQSDLVIVHYATAQMKLRIMQELLVKY